MKRLFTFLLVAFTLNAIMLAQLPTIVLDDFENGQVNFTAEVKVNPSAHFDIAVVDNPVKAGINTSNKVWEWKRYDAEADNKIWAGFFAVLKEEIPKGYHRIEIKYLRKNSTSQMKIKPQGVITKEIASVSPATKTNEWETLVFDIYAAGIKNITTFGFFPDFYTPIDAAAIVYVDDIKIIFDPSIIIPPPPTFISFFTNSASDYFHDNSWASKTAPSSLAAVGTDPSKTGEKIPVVTTPVKEGTNALKLQWKSVETGDWKALVAAKGWSPADVSEMTYLKFWVNSPAALARVDMPKLRFEATTGKPNNTGKVLMGDYLAADLVANTWVEVTIPLADIWAVDPAFIAKEYIKGVFFSQNITDNVEHTMFIDDVRFIKVIAGEVFFDDSASDRFHDQSWSFKNSPSTLVQENWEGPDMPNGDKLPVVTAPVKSGTNALKLQWKSAPEGSWAAMVAALDWKHFDLTKQTHFQFWVNSPATLNKENLPKVYFEAHSGTPNKTGKINLGNYVVDLAANTWTEVRIPLADFWAADPAFTAKDDVKGIFFEQNVANNVEHTMIMDDFKFISVAPNAVENIIEKAQLKMYYRNNALRTADYTGSVQVYNIAGKLIAEGQSILGFYNVSLDKGLYLVRTSIGNSKLVVQ